MKLENKTNRMIRNCARRFKFEIISFMLLIHMSEPPPWSNGQGSWLQIQMSRARFQALPNVLANNGSGTGYTQLRDDN
jgi:hypothetical protein